MSRKRSDVVATIAYGWESRDFYIKWFHGFDDPEVINQMQGPILNLGSPQSDLAPALLNLVRDTLLKDPAYLERLKQHYFMFKEKVDPAHFQPNSQWKALRIQKSKGRKRH